MVQLFAHFGQKKSDLRHLTGVHTKKLMQPYLTAESLRFREIRQAGNLPKWLSGCLGPIHPELHGSALRQLTLKIGRRIKGLAMRNRTGYRLAIDARKLITRRRREIHRLVRTRARPQTARQVCEAASFWLL